MTKWGKGNDELEIIIPCLRIGLNEGSRRSNARVMPNRTAPDWPIDR